jgi:hypothetical protein
VSAHPGVRDHDPHGPGDHRQDRVDELDRGGDQRRPPPAGRSAAGRTRAAAGPTARTGRATSARRPAQLRARRRGSAARAARWHRRTSSPSAPRPRRRSRPGSAPTRPVIVPPRPVLHPISRRVDRSWSVSSSTRVWCSSRCRTPARKKYARRTHGHLLTGSVRTDRSRRPGGARQRRTDLTTAWTPTPFRRRSGSGSTAAVDWVFARDLLHDGLIAAVGTGEVRVQPVPENPGNVRQPHRGPARDRLCGSRR